MTRLFGASRPARYLTACLLAGAGLALGLLLLLGVSLFGGRAAPAWAVSPPGCSITGSTINVVLGGGGTATYPDKIGIDNNGQVELYLSNGTASGAWTDCGPASDSVVLAPSGSYSSEYLEVDLSGTQTNGGSLTYDEPEPVTISSNNYCLDLSGSIAPSHATGDLIVADADNGDVSVGSTSITVAPSSTASATCPISVPTGVTALQLVGQGADTLATASSGADASIPTTVEMDDPGITATETVAVGNAGDTTLDFSGTGLGSTEDCTGSCTLYVNTTSGSPTVAPDGSTALTGGLTAVGSDTADLVTTAGNESYAFTGATPLDFDFASVSAPYTVDFWAGNGTYTIPSLPAGSEFAADGTTSTPTTVLGSSAAPTSASGSSFYDGAEPATLYVTGTSDSFTAGTVATATDTFVVSDAAATSTTGDTFTGGAGTNTFTLTGSYNTVTGGAGVDTVTVTGNNNTVTGSTGTGTGTGSSDTFTISGNGNSVTAESRQATFSILSGTGNTLTGGTSADTFTATGTSSGNTFYCGTGQDTVTTGGTGGNTFYAAGGPDYFYASGSGNIVNFSNVATGSTAEQLTINASGAPQEVGGQQLPSGEAAIGSNSPAYFFYDGSGVSTSKDFTTYVGSSVGYTEIIAGDNAGLTFTGSGSSNSALFDTTYGIIANLNYGGATEPVAAINVAAGTPVTDASGVSAGQVLVYSGSTEGIDTLSDVYTLTEVTGYSTFWTGTGSTPFSVTDVGTATSSGHNTFYGSSAQVTFTSGGEGNDFVAGPGVEYFDETDTTQTADNTIDFSNISTGPNTTPANTTTRLVINVSTVSTAVAPYTAGLVTTVNNTSSSTTSSTESWSFSSGGSQFNILVGSIDGYTTFEAGSGNYDYNGQYNGSDPAQSGNILDFSEFPAAAATPLTLDASQSANGSVSGQINLAGVTGTWQDIYDLIGLNTGYTTFDGGSAGGFIFSGNKTNNTAGFTSSATVNLATQQSTTIGGAGGTSVSANPVTITHPSSPSEPADYLVGISSIVLGSGNTAQQFTLDVGSTNETISDAGTGDTDTLDFQYVSTSPSPAQDELTVDVSGDPNSGTATVNGVTYTFTTGTSAFTQFIGSSDGNTIYLASPNSGYSYEASGSNNSISFSQATSGITVEYCNATAAVVALTGSVTCNGASLPASIPTGDDVITGLTTVTGANGGGNTFEFESGLPSNSNTYDFIGNGDNNTFKGGPTGTETFQSNGSGNTFTAGESNEIFSDSDNQGVNDVNLDGLANSAVVNVTGSTTAVGSVNNDTAASGSYTYTFTSFNAPVVFYGSPDGTTFYAGSTPDTFEGEGPASANTLSFYYATGTGALSLTVGSAAACPALGVAQYGSVTENFCGIAALDGLQGGYTTFVAAPAGATTLVGGYSFIGSDEDNSITFANAPKAIQANLVTGQVACLTSQTCGLSSPDTITNITTVTGGAANGNLFYAADRQNDVFYVPSGSTGNVVNFNAVSTGTSSELTIYASGQQNGTADGDGAVYTFTSTPGAFTAFYGANNGYTDFVASASGSSYIYDAVASTPGNMVNFSAVTDDLDVVYNSANPTDATVTWGAGADSASIGNITTVIGSDEGGDAYTTYGGSYSITTANGGHGNTFNLGTGNVVISDPSSGNIINFGGVGGALTVNVSGTNGALTNGEASNGSSTYTFNAGYATTFDGTNSGSTIFEAGATAGDVFDAGSAPATLDFSETTSSGPLTICVVANHAGTCTAGEILIGSVHESFNGITVFDGLISGSTTFVADNTDTGLTFTGNGTISGTTNANTVDFSTASQGVTVDLGTGTASFTSGSDTLSDIQAVYGSASQPNDFIAGPSSETFKDLGTGSKDTLDFSNLSTSSGSQLVINVSNSTATAGGYTYTFSTGAADFTTFIGSDQGNTDFVAARNSGGYTFTGQGSDNTADFRANTVGITANLSGATVGTLSSGQVTVTSGASGYDTVADVQFLYGSPTAANTFYAGLTGTEFESTSGYNTLSYAGYNAPGEAVFVDEPTSTVYQLDTVNDTPVTSGSADTYSLPGTLVIEGSPGNDVFEVGTTTTVLEGGGGTDVLDLAALDGVTVDLGAGTVTGNSSNNTAIGGISWNTCSTSGCPATDLVIGAIDGSQGADTYRLPSYALDGTGTTLDLTQSTQPLVITATSRSGATLDLSEVTDQGASVVMPVNTGKGSVTGLGSELEAVTFSGVNSLLGTSYGGDYVYAGTGTETLTETAGSTGTLDLSKLPQPSGSYTGATINVTDSAGVYEGTITTPAQVGLSQASVSGFATFVGTAGNDTFTQTGNSPTGGYTFDGRGGANTVNLSSGVTGTTLTLTAPITADDCSAGTNNNDGVVVDSQDNSVDTFSCVGNITSTGSTFEVAPGQAATLNGGGSGTLELIDAPTGEGATINLLTGTISGAGGYDFTFSGMTTVYGTAYNDTFIAGHTAMTIYGNGGSDAVSFVDQTGAVEVNLSDAPYLIPTSPSGYANAGSDLAAGSATLPGGVTMTLYGISSVIGTPSYNDLLVGPSSGSGTMVGGTGNVRFVLSGAFEYITTGSGSSVIDLSDLPGQTRLDLSAEGPQYLGAADDGGVWILAGNVSEVIGSPGGSTLLGGSGATTLVGGSGSDTLIAGSGNQTLQGGGGSDTLIGGSGTDSLEGGSSPVTFVPGSGTEYLTSQTTGNSLDYQGIPNPVLVNLTSSSESIPPGQEDAGTTIQGNSASGGWGATVSLAGAGITSVTGNTANDVFVVGSDDRVTGGTGNDLFVVDGGGNTLTAGTSTQSTFLFIAGSNGAVNVIQGGGDGTVDFSQGTAGVTVNLQAGTASGGFSGNSSSDQLSGILNVVGTPYNDILVGNGVGGIIDGDGANLGCTSQCGDFLQAGPNGGDTLEAGPNGSGSGNDTFCANPNCVESGTTTGGGDTMIGGSGNDFFFADYGAGDTIYGEGGYNTAEVGPEDKYTGINALIT